MKIKYVEWHLNKQLDGYNHLQFQDKEIAQRNCKELLENGAVEILKETEKAYLIKFENEITTKSEWIPKSAIVAIEQ